MCGSLYMVMDKVLELMSKRKWQKHCLRVNVAQPEDIKITGSVKVAKIYSNVLNNREKEPELNDAIRDVSPEWCGDDIQITLNKDLVCKRHRDHANKEHSWILWLGDFTGGALNLDDGTKVRKQVLHRVVQGHEETKKLNASRRYAGNAGGSNCSSKPNSSSIRGSGTLYRSLVLNLCLTEARYMLGLC